MPKWMDAPIVEDARPAWKDAPIVPEQTEPSFINRAERAQQEDLGAFESARRSFTGYGRTRPQDEDLPEFASTIRRQVLGGTTVEDPALLEEDRPDQFTNTLQPTTVPQRDRGAKLIRASVVPLTQLGKFNAIRKVDPSARLEIDEYGNGIVTLEGKRSYINKPGISESDVQEVIGEGLIEAPLLLALGGGGGAIAGGVGRVLGTATGAGGASILRQVLGNLMGADESPDLVRAGTIAGMAGTAEALLPPLFRFVSRSMKSARMVADDALTPAGREAFRRAGIDPDTVTSDFIRRWRASASRSGQRDAAARSVQAQSLDPPINPTTGQLTQDPRQLAFEGQFKNRGRGQGENPLLDVQDANEIALRQNLQNIRRGTGGGTGSARDAAEAAQSRLVSRERAGRRLVNIRYDAARRAGTQGQTTVPKGASAELSARIRVRLADEVLDAGDAPRTFRLIAEIDDEIQRAGQNVSINNLFARRAKLNKVASGGGQDGVAASNARRELDDWLNDAVHNDLIQGNAEAITAWRRAIRTRSDIGRIFDNDDIVKRLTERVKGSPTILKVDPEDAVNVLFGRATLGNKTKLSRDLTTLRRVLGENSEEWLGLRDAAFLRLMRSQPRQVVESSVPGAAVNETTPFFSGANFAKELDALLEKPRAALILFDRTEIALMRRLRDVAIMLEKRPQSLVKGNPNVSGTALANTMESTLGRLGRLGRVALQFFGRRLSDAMETVAARQAASGTIPRPSANVPAAGLSTIPFNPQGQE
tara:strand:- start:1340 stop:3628 length:2289 start_codon:yes stop_codon:yes gene_type:complete